MNEVNLHKEHGKIMYMIQSMYDELNISLSILKGSIEDIEKRLENIEIEISEIKE